MKINTKKSKAIHVLSISKHLSTFFQTNLTSDLLLIFSTM